MKFTGLTAQDQPASPDSLNLEKNYQIKYDLNTVTKAELETIPGIGPKTAETILSYRKENGFNNKIDLLNIKGIGEKTFAKLEKYFHDLGKNKLESTSKQTTNIKKQQNQDKININTANSVELQKLKGIGPSKADRIIQYRNEHGNFNSIEDLQKVKGIGPKTILKLKEFITVGDLYE